ncbi:hypothetical protein [Mangrovimonas aestuarii]|uniref:hypothetical protein n=1 Tax=Mangrovimonas aestuarii TaxID=3018443 RepID=UPI002379CB82|nr:hypothetical protein [Mangrovimonas aestuarii]
MRQFLTNNIKNVYGWRTNRKIVVISVDDYGNVRLNSKIAREKMDKAGLKVHTRFDALDALETREDLEALFEVLSSVRDKNDRHAVFTPFAMPCNINFDAMAENNYEEYEYELLPVTYQKLSVQDPKAYEDTWNLWLQGIKEGFLKPQFHGREHFNLKVFEEKLQKRDIELLTSLKNHSYTSISNTGYSTIGYTAAFEFWEFDENIRFKKIIEEGLNAFEQVYGYRAIHFNPPGGREHPIIHQYLKDNGIEYMDTPFIKQEHQGKGKFKKIFNYTGKSNHINMIYQVRNVVFEPTNNRGFDWVEYSFKQIESAFRFGRPAIVSTHRINFSGHIVEENRKIGLNALGKLLTKIVNKWPEVEFMTADQLGDVIAANKSN